MKNTDMKAKLTDTESSMGNGAMGVAKNLQSRAKDAWESVEEQTKRAMHETAAFASRHPLSTALVTCGAGLVAGLLLKSRAPATFKDTYVVKPLHQSRGLLLGVLIACGTLFKRTFSRHSHAVEKAGNSAKAVVKKVKRSARKTAKKAAVLLAAGMLTLLPTAHDRDKVAGGDFSMHMPQNAISTH